MRMDVSVSVCGGQVSAEVSVVGSETATASAGGIQIGGAFVGRFSFALLQYFVYFVFHFIRAPNARTSYQLSNKTELRVSLSLTLFTLCVCVCLFFYIYLI